MKKHSLHMKNMMIICVSSVAYHTTKQSQKSQEILIKNEIKNIFNENYKQERY